MQLTRPAKINYLRKIVVDFLRVWTAIFYAYNSVLQQSVPQRIQSAVIPHMYSYAPPPTGSDGCSTSSSSPGKYIIQFLLVPPPTGSRGSVSFNHRPHRILHRTKNNRWNSFHLMIETV